MLQVEPQIPPTVLLVEPVVEVLCRRSRYADVRRAAAGQAAGLVLKIGII